MDWALATVAAVLVVFAVVSRRIHGSVITLPIFFVAAGLLLGDERVGLIDLHVESETIKVIAEATLALILFADASRINLGALKREYSVPLRLLGIGLPLTIVAGLVTGVGMFSELSVLEALILAVILAPTDAALGQAVVTDPRLPSPIRQGLNVESGLNDGICVPLLIIAITLTEAETGSITDSHAVTLLLEQIGYGTIAGVAAGAVAAFASRRATQLDSIEPDWLRILPVAAAALAYGIAVGLGGSGFIAAFVGGLVYGGLSRPGTDEASGFIDQTGELLNSITFLLFGAALLGPALDVVTWEIAAYAVLSLTVVRMIPVAIALIGSHAHPWTVAYVGWFGPRGLASIVFGAILVSEASIPHVDTILACITITIAMSVSAHGLSAAPATNRYVRWYKSHPDVERLGLENVEVSDHRWRRRLV